VMNLNGAFHRTMRNTVFDFNDCGIMVELPLPSGTKHFHDQPIQSRTISFFFFVDYFLQFYCPLSVETDGCLAQCGNHSRSLSRGKSSKLGCCHAGKRKEITGIE